MTIFVMVTTHFDLGSFVTAEVTKWPHSVPQVRSEKSEYVMSGASERNALLMYIVQLHCCVVSYRTSASCSVVLLVILFWLTN